MKTKPLTFAIELNSDTVRILEGLGAPMGRTVAQVAEIIIQQEVIKILLAQLDKT